MKHGLKPVGNTPMHRICSEPDLQKDGNLPANGESVLPYTSDRRFCLSAFIPLQTDEVQREAHEVLRRLHLPFYAVGKRERKHLMKLMEKS